MAWRWIIAATLRGSVHPDGLYSKRTRNGTQAVPYGFADGWSRLSRAGLEGCFGEVLSLRGLLLRFRFSADIFVAVLESNGRCYTLRMLLNRYR